MEEEYICKCCLVTEDEIIDGVRNHEVRNIEDLRNLTMATSGCGKCKYMCEAIINSAIND